MSRVLAGLACAAALLICSPQLADAGVPRGTDAGATPERALPVHVAGATQQADRAGNPWWAFWRSDSSDHRRRKSKGGFPTAPSSTPQPAPQVPYYAPKSSEVPELDPGAAGSALLLLLGGSLVLLDRRRAGALR